MDGGSRSGVIERLRRLRYDLSLPAAAKAEARRDRTGLPAHDPGIDAASRDIGRVSKQRAVADRVVVIGTERGDATAVGGR